MADWIKLNFTRHEIWALAWARKLPPLAVFLFASLLVWFFGPALVVIAVFALTVAVFPIVFVFIKAWLLPFAILGALVANVFLLLFIPWYFRWYFITVGLMFGRTNMAKNKMEELQRRLVRLEASK